MTFSDLEELYRLEAGAVTARLLTVDESINPITNREQALIRVVRADQDVAAWWMKHSAEIKAILRHEISRHEF